ncbi:MAG: HEAT repeat domain-containing protein, partial [Kofleriaceae bacterium]
RAAVREAARDPDPSIMLAGSRDPDREVAIVATEALAKLHAHGDVAASEMIARATDKSLDERVRVSAINGLGLVGSPEAARTLSELVHRGDLLEKRSAAILPASGSRARGTGVDRRAWRFRRSRTRKRARVAARTRTWP